MNEEDVEARIAAIKATAGDDETAHGMEDDLRADFLRALAEGRVVPETIAELAALVLSTGDIEFERWCA